MANTTIKTTCRIDEAGNLVVAATGSTLREATAEELEVCAPVFNVEVPLSLLRANATEFLSYLRAQSALLEAAGHDGNNY